MITKKKQFGNFEVEIKARDGVGSIRTPTHKYTRSLYELIKNRAMSNAGITLSSHNKIEYVERLNAIIETFPEKTEYEIMQMIEADFAQLNEKEMHRITEDFKNARKIGK